MKKQAIMVAMIAAIIVSFVVLPVLIRERVVSEDTPYLYFPTLKANEKQGTFIITISKPGEKNKYVYFSEARELLKHEGIAPIEIKDTQELVGKEMTDIITLYGEPHTDIGSGFYIPAYITENAYLIAVHLDNNGVVSDVLEEDLIKEQKAGILEDD